MIDLQAISAGARKELIKLGKRFSSVDVLAQAAQTMKHFARSEGVLELYGYGSQDVEVLAWLCGKLEDEIERRDTRVVGRRQLRAGAAEAEQKGRDARSLARSVLRNATANLQRQGRDDSIRHIRAVIEETTHANPDFDLLARHLAQLQKAFDECVVGAVSTPAITHALGLLEDARNLMAEAHLTRPRQRGTPYASEQVDFLDGLIIENLRAARRAAEQAAKALGRPHLIRAFRLDELYGRPRSSSAAPSPQSEVPEDAQGVEEEGETFDD